MRRRPIVHLLALAAVVAPLAACSPTIRKPQLLHPGSAPVQRYNATQFDPYPLPDMGPEIVGGRPPDYLVPVPEVERANQFREQSMARVQPVLVPQTPVFVPTIPAAPTGYAPAMPPNMPPVEYRY